jgi:hypothetical protein
MEYLSYDALFMPLATAMIAFGGYPEPPMVFKDLIKNEWFRWLLVFVLIFQGRAGGDVMLAAVATIVLLVIVKVLDKVYKPKETYF